MQKIRYCSILAILCVLNALSSCQREQRSKKDLLVSIEAQRYFAETLLGDSLRIATLIPKGSNPEEYDPSPQDIEKLAAARAYFYVGQLGFEKAWLKKIEDLNPDLELVDLSHKLEERLMEEEMHADCGGDHSHELGGDPHYWSSISGARAMALAFYESLLKLFPEEQNLLDLNYSKLIAEIDSTAQEILQTLQHERANKAFVIYHPSLSYFAAENHLKQLVIEENGKEPSAAHLSKIIEQAKQLRVETVFMQKEFDSRLVSEVAKEIGAEIVEINPLSNDWKGELMRIAQALSKHVE